MRTTMLHKCHHYCHLSTLTLLITTIAPFVLSQESNWYQPAVGTSWQIELENPLTNISIPVQVFDSDLFSNTNALITSIHQSSKKSICYFSAGSYENWRPDAGEFTPSDYGKPLGGPWSGEYWLNISSPNVRRIMLQRLDQAASKGCDAVDPDNMDGYENDNGLGLTQDDSVNYMQFLSQAAHSRQMGIGLKNAGDIIPRVLDLVEFSVNEQCEQYSECDTFRPFIDAGKPVFHIEYTDAGATKSQIANFCTDPTAAGFSTLIKHLDLDDWYESCPTSKSNTNISTSASSTQSASATATATVTLSNLDSSSATSSPTSDSSSNGANIEHNGHISVALALSTTALSVFFLS